MKQYQANPSFFYFLSRLLTDTIKIVTILFFTINFLLGQTHIAADPYYLLNYEKDQFQNRLPISQNIFRPIFLHSDTLAISILLRSEHYYNNNAPNQENMDVRFFSKGTGSFNSIQLAINSPYFSFLAEPFISKNESFNVINIQRENVFSVLNDQDLSGDKLYKDSHFRNLLAFIHFNGIGFGWHKGNRWWGPGIHSSLQMSNNTVPFSSQIFGTINELRFGSFGFYGLYSFSKLNEKQNNEAKYFTSLNANLSWYGQLIISLGISRNYLTGGDINSTYLWTEKDAKKIVLEGFLTSNLIDNEYTIGGHDIWDQTLSTYLSIMLPKRNIKIYTEVGMNDNRMFFADLLSQPDHSMATIIGIRDYGLGNNMNIVWGFEVTNLMITYTSRHRPGGGGEWYEKNIYDYSSYKGRRWSAHSGTDSDDWYLYFGYMSDKFSFIPGLNYERHGIVSHRPAEVKLEFRIDTRYKYRDSWFGLYFEKQFEAFLGFPDYFYVDSSNNPIDVSEGKLANSRHTTTLILNFSKTINK